MITLMSRSIDDFALNVSLYCFPFSSGTFSCLTCTFQSASPDLSIVNESALSSFKLSTTYDAFAEESTYGANPDNPSLNEPFLISAVSTNFTLSIAASLIVSNLIEIFWFVYSTVDGSFIV